MLQLWLLPAAVAATLPGVDIPFSVDAGGRWVLARDLPSLLVDAGVKPGWVLSEVDGLAFQNPHDVQARVAEGPARDIQLRFEVPGAPEAILVAPRAPLVYAVTVDVVGWPEGVTKPTGTWHEDWSGAVVTEDGNQTRWALHAESGNLVRGASQGWTQATVPDLFWELSPATWAIDKGSEIEIVEPKQAKYRYAQAAHLKRYKGHTGEFLASQQADGVHVVEVKWPRGTPGLPTCRSWVPETCLTSSLDILQTLGDRPSARPEAARQMGLACSGGVHRACYEAVALEDPGLAPQVQACTSNDVSACNAVAAARLAIAPDSPDDVVLGLLEYACELEGSGTLGERLRRIEEVGAGCMNLATAYEARNMPDQALLNLDQACVLGRADACELAAERRHQAFAASTVRECEDPDIPIASSCVELGRLLQKSEVPLTELDDFDAFLRGCSLGAAAGCEALGDYVDRWGIENWRVRESERALSQSCAEGEQRACLGAAHLLVRHEPNTADYGKALQLFDQACKGGLADACIGGAQQRRIGQAKKVGAPEQIAMWTSACDLQDPYGCSGLGEKQARASRTWPDAYTAWSRACDLGDPHACSELGRLVEKRHNPPWDNEQPPNSYLTRGCDNGDPEGCFWLAEKTLPRNDEPPEATFKLLQRSCDGQSGEGCAALANVHLLRNRSFDDEVAAKHLDTACSNAHFDSCRLLGTMYLRGKGVEKDRERARELLDRFRRNATRRHLRIGLQAGLPIVAGGAAELVLPLPVGPAFSAGGSYSYLPGAGDILVLIDGDSDPRKAPDLTTIEGVVRIYPNNRARGAFAAFGFHQITADGGSLAKPRQRLGWSARAGIREQSGVTFQGVELGISQFGVMDLNDFDEEEQGLIPVVIPMLGLNLGLALL